MFNERGHVYMSEQEEGLQGRLVVGAKRDGRRKYDESAKRELIQACLKPGVSIARTAMDHGINPNLVRTWISQYQRVSAAAPSDEPAFIPVEAPVLPAAPIKSTSTFQLSVRLPNGVRLEVGQTSAEELETIIHMLGRLSCSGSTKG